MSLKHRQSRIGQRPREVADKWAECARLADSIVSRLMLIAVAGYGQASTRIDQNIVYEMHGGLSMLMDVHYPDRSNGSRSLLFRAVAGTPCSRSAHGSRQRWICSVFGSQARATPCSQRIIARRC